MAGSPFAGKGGTAAKSTAAAAPAAKQQAPADLPDATNMGEDAPVGNDPYAASDPTGISALKPIAFMNQLVLLHPTKAGRMVTVNSGNEEDGKSPFAEFDLIPLTVPAEGGTPTKEQPVRNGDEITVLNKDGDPETFDAYEVGERLDDLRFFNKPLVAEAEKALRKNVSWILGRITYGVKKPNQSRPIILVPGSDEDKALYQEWRKSVASG